MLRDLMREDDILLEETEDYLIVLDFSGHKVKIYTPKPTNLTKNGKKNGRPFKMRREIIYEESDYYKEDGTPKKTGKNGKPLGGRANYNRKQVLEKVYEERDFITKDGRLNISKNGKPIGRPKKPEAVQTQEEIIKEEIEAETGEQYDDVQIIKVQDIIIPMFDDVLYDILGHRHVHYVLKGGRGSTKSSFIALAIPLLIIDNPNVNAVCFRKIGNTIQNSIYAQIVWAIHTLGLESLFHIPKVYSNPIIYMPTGQKIFFTGMDDPNKIKSITTAKGYIGITWFEELDQFNGEYELRKVLQSTMRGGDKFWDFRSFNPPMSINNWANMYAEESKDKKDTLIVSNNYLDVPKEWVGQQFIEEAEDLKVRNEKAYQHEYLGLAVGTGGTIFENVSDLNMEQPIDIDGTCIPLWQTFDNIYCGIDWGFARDPFRFVRVHYDIRKHDLYIFDEYNSLESRNVVIFEELYDNLKKINRTELVTADSAEPKSIADFKAYGAFIRGAEKGPESRRYGTKWLQGLRNIFIDKRRCPLTYKEFVMYEYERDKEGNFISNFPDGDDHGIDACRYALEKFYKRKGN
jgi:PBSX family phage terminase large subunit